MIFRQVNGKSLRTARLQRLPGTPEKLWRETILRHRLPRFLQALISGAFVTKMTMGSGATGRKVLLSLTRLLNKPR